jgi:hypothetical protein
MTILTTNFENDLKSQRDKENLECYLNELIYRMIMHVKVVE